MQDVRKVKKLTPWLTNKEANMKDICFLINICFNENCQLRIILRTILK